LSNVAGFRFSLKTKSGDDKICPLPELDSRE